MSVLKTDFTFEYDALFCSNCGTPWAMPTDYLAMRRADHRRFYCPNGHANVFRMEGGLHETATEPGEPERPAPAPASRSALVGRSSSSPIKTPRRRHRKKSPSKIPTAPSQLVMTEIDPAAVLPDVAVKAHRRRLRPRQSVIQGFEAPTAIEGVPVRAHQRTRMPIPRIAEGVLAVVGTGTPVAKVARQFRVSTSTVYSIVREAKQAEAAASAMQEHIAATDGPMA